jgi:DNA ligase-1
VAWDRAAGKILPFQVLATRGRKAVELEEIKVQVRCLLTAPVPLTDIFLKVCLYAFDLLFLNGVSLVRQPLKR